MSGSATATARPQAVTIGGGFAGLWAPDIAAPLRHILRDQTNARVLMAEVSGIEVDRKQVTLAEIARHTLRQEFRRMQSAPSPRSAQAPTLPESG